ncbi:unnamed protein product [Toxocara canis]|uniref:UPAR/Ly6 domain-containing protein n=1 Tax=Toxocara canis TaxID=6265 RepID=A0A183TV14_TOXCA|nr:unnamed protein product [Toxocara canis]
MPRECISYFIEKYKTENKDFQGGPTINNGSLLVPLQECPMLGAYSCTKTLDLSTNLVTRQCSPTNCTQNGVVMTTSICYNTTVGVSYQTNCCCYGDGCNSAPSLTNSMTAIITVIALAFWLSSPL